MLPKASCTPHPAPPVNATPETPATGAGFTAEHPSPSRPDPARRVHWVSLNPVLQWSVLRLCLPSHRLRALMAPFVDAFSASNFELRCEATRRGAQHAGLARLLQRELEHLHRSAIERSCSANTEAELLAQWEQARGTGTARSACWALLADRQTSARLSLLVSREMETWPDDAGSAEQGAALAPADAEPATAARWQARLALLQTQLDHAAARREHDAAEVGFLRMQVQAVAPSWTLQATLLENAKAERERAESLSLALMLQAERREAAEAAVLSAESNLHRLQQEADQFKYHAGELARELRVEQQLQQALGNDSPCTPAVRNWISGRKLLYLGGRPGSNKAIRAMVNHAGGEYRRHEGVVDVQGAAFLQDLAWADLVLAPMDSCDRESVVATRRACQQHECVYVPLRTSTLASFAAGLHATFAHSALPPPSNAFCLRHG